jgi:hypothetical protein
MPETNSNGFLIVKVSSASGAIPIENASVIIQGKDYNNQNILFSFLTDRDGLTPKITLPAPSKELSEAPTPLSKPYSTYNIEVYREGYYTQRYRGIPIFSGITAVQNARIIPVAELDSQNPYYSSGQSFEEYENPFL